MRGFLLAVLQAVLPVMLLPATAALPAPPASAAPPSTTLVGQAQEAAEMGTYPVGMYPGPSTVFSQQNNTELRSQVGTTAVLHCYAHNVGENTVSWIRRRDYHLLTVGSQTYSSDDRFQVRYIKHENDWQLHIRYVQVRDEGVYECQVSSHPPVSLLATLHVLQATSEILGGPEKYMTVGSSLRLVCVLRDNTQPPTYVFWYHDQHMINYHATREVRVENNGGLSVLFLSNVRPADSGNYSCAPSNARPAHIYIHVLKGGETPAAIHSGGSSGTCLMLLPLLLYLALCLASTCLISPSCCAMDSGVKVPRSIPGGEMDMGHNCAPSRHGMGVPPMTVMYVAARNQHFSQRKSTSLPGLSDAAVFCCHVRYYGCQLEKYSRRRLGGCSMAVGIRIKQS